MANKKEKRGEIRPTRPVSLADLGLWLGSWWEWVSVVLVFLTLEIAVLSIEQAGWIRPQPSLTLVLVLGFRRNLLGLFALPLAQILGWVAWLFTTYAIKVSELFSALPFASVDVKVGLPLVCTYYVLIAIALWLIAKRRQLRRWFPKRRNI